VAKQIDTAEIDAMRSLPPDRLDQAVQDGDLLFASGRHWMSRLIQLASGSSWSHVAILRRAPDTKEILVLESVEDEGVRAFPLEHYLTAYKGGCPYHGRLVLARLDGLPDGAAGAAIAHANALLGYDYDRWEIARIALRIGLRMVVRFMVGAAAWLVWRLTGRRVLGMMRRGLGRLAPRRRLPPFRNERFMCSEFVWEAYRAAGVHLGVWAAERRGPDFTRVFW
jgi:hypothetical protein